MRKVDLANVRRKLRGLPRSVEIPTTTFALLTRPFAEGCADGTVVLADPATTAEAGFRWPVYLSRAAWDRHIVVTPAAAAMLCDERGRLWDVAWMLTRAMRGHDGHVLRFGFYGVVNEPRVQHCTLYAIIAVQDDRPHLVLVTAPEAVGEEVGKAINTYDALLRFDDEPDDCGDPELW